MGRGRSGVKMQLGAAAAGRRCSGARPSPSAPHSSVPLSAAFRSKRDGESEGSLPNPSCCPVSLSLLHLLTLSFPSKRPHLPSPQPTSSSLYGPSQSPHPPTSPFPSLAISSSFPLCFVHYSWPPSVRSTCTQPPVLRIYIICTRTRPCTVPICSYPSENPGDTNSGLPTRRHLRGDPSPRSTILEPSTHSRAT